MKRTALLLLTVIYFVSCVGMSVNRFYCCGKLASTTITCGAADNSASQCGNKNKCCKNEKQCFKVKDNHFSVATFSLNIPGATLLPCVVNLDSHAIISHLQTKIVYKGNAPPGHPNVAVYILNCAYRI